MKKHLLGIIAVIQILFSGYLLFLNGIIRDEYYLSSESFFYQNSLLWYGLLLGFIDVCTWFVFTASGNIITQRKTFLQYFLTVITIAYLVVYGIFYNNYRNVLVDTTYEEDKYIVLNAITLEELFAIHEEQEDFIVYIGRDTCSKCQLIGPLLESELSHYELEAMYYNTEADRHDRAEAMWRVLDLYAIETVPTVVIRSNGEFESKYIGDEITNEFFLYLAEAYK